MITVYTAILANSDHLKLAPVGEGRSCVCFWDSSLPRPRDARGWDLVPVAVGPHPRHTAWELRCRSDLLFPESDQTLWIDGSFHVLDLVRLLDDAGDAEAVSMRHPERTTCYEEGAELVKIGQAPADSIERQLAKYRADGFMPTAISTPGILLRRHTERVAAFNGLWQDQIRRYVENSQVSIDYCAWKVGLSIRYLDGVYTENPYVRYDSVDHQKRRKPYVW